MSRVPLWSRKKIVGHAIVNARDWLTVMKYRWNLTGKGYARTSLSQTKQLLMHRLILNLPSHRPWVDHINRNKLDNRRENLRIADAHLNSINRGSQKNNKSGIVGVHKHSRVIAGRRYTYWVAEADGKWLGQSKSKARAISLRKKYERTNR